MKLLISFFILLLVCTVVEAKDINAPPPLSGEPAAEQFYFQELYDNWNELEHTNSNPNGTRSGSAGEIIWYETVFKDQQFIALNIDGALHWWAVEFTDIL